MPPGSDLIDADYTQLTDIFLSYRNTWASSATEDFNVDVPTDVTLVGMFVYDMYMYKLKGSIHPATLLLATVVTRL